MGDKDKGMKKPFPAVTFILLLFIIALQLYISMLPESEALKLFETFSLKPLRFLEGENPGSIVTYMFLHGNLLHLFINSIALYGGGNIVESEIGHLKYLVAFLISGIMAGLVHSLLNSSSNIPMVGSSGAIFGVIAILFLLMPFKLTFLLIFPLPSVIVGLLLIAVELSAFLMSADVNIAHDAHLSGFIVGALCAFLIDRKRAIKGVIIAVSVLIIIYLLGVYLNLIPIYG